MQISCLYFSNVRICPYMQCKHLYSPVTMKKVNFLPNNLFIYSFIQLGTTLDFGPGSATGFQVLCSGLTSETTREILMGLGRDLHVWG